MKKIILLLVMILSLTASTYAMEEVEINGLKYQLVSKTKDAKLIKCIELISSDVVIPETIEHEGVTYSVTSIGDEVFKNCIGLTSIKIGNNVKTIGKSVFYMCYKLTSINIGNNLTSIEESAFYECTNLTSVYISDIEAWCNIAFKSSMSNPLVYAKHLFFNGEEIKNLVIPNSITSIKANAFRNCISLSSVTIPNSVTYIGDLAFDGCSNLTSVTIGNSVTSIGKSAFWGCKSLTSVTIPNSVTSIEEEAFYGCYGLTSVTIENGLKSINKNVFYGCTNLTSISIPNSVTSIGYQAFYNCGLTSVTIPNSVSSIDFYAFSGCGNLTTITIGNGLTSIGGYAFNRCSSLSSVYISDLEAWCKIHFGDNPLSYAQHLYLNGEEVKDLVIPSSITKIGYQSFLKFVGLNSVTISNSVTSIEESAFRGCSSLISVTVGNSVTSIGYNSFSYCSSLTSIVIPNSVKKINDFAFNYCSGLTKITLGKSVKEIGYESFGNCPEITDVFCYAVNVPNMFYFANNSTPSTCAFEGSYIESATLHVPEASIELYKAKEPWKNFKTIEKINMPKHTLTYMIDDELFKAFEIEEGTAITPEPAPTKEGYSFSGWSDIPETMPAHDVTVTGTFIKDLEKCAIPTIRIVDGELVFDCDTKGVTFKWSYNFNGGNVESNGKKAILAGSTNCHVTVYATKEGYQDSDFAEVDVELNVGILGDTNRDGRVTITDAVGIVNIILNNSGSSAPIMEVKGPEVEVKSE